MRVSVNARPAVYFIVKIVSNARGKARNIFKLLPRTNELYLTGESRNIFPGDNNGARCDDHATILSNAYRQSFPKTGVIVYL